MTVAIAFCILHIVAIIVIAQTMFASGHHRAMAEFYRYFGESLDGLKGNDAREDMLELLNSLGRVRFRPAFFVRSVRYEVKKELTDVRVGNGQITWKEEIRE